jgi:glycosyltransferase involved in cell wall biosynthesis
MTSKSVLICAHKYATQPDDDLLLYLNRGGYTTGQITHTFPASPVRVSRSVIFENGNQVFEKSNQDRMKWPNTFVMLREVIFTLKVVLQNSRTWDVYIGMDGMVSSLGILLKFLGKVSKVVMWSMDYVPQNRFKGRLAFFQNWVYRTINKYALTNVDEVWDISPRMFEARKKFDGIEQTDYRSHKIVPYGVWVQRVKKLKLSECIPQSIIFMGHLLEKQGVQLAIEALNILQTNYPDITLGIIGGGSYMDELVKLVEKYQLKNKVTFYGNVKDHEELEDIISKHWIAVAPYIKKLDTWTYYADPGKIKVYLACGVPVVTTDIPWNAYDLQAKKCGKVVDDTIEGVTQGIRFLFNEKVNQEYRENTHEYSKSFDYEIIFKKLCQNL